MLRVCTRVLVGHMHNALVDNLSAGEPMEPATYAAMFPAPDLFDDRELTAALVERRIPRPATLHGLADAPAVALAVGTARPGLAAGPLTDSQAGSMLRRNPLYQDGKLVWPSERYEREYGALATYPARSDAPDRARAGETPAVDALACRRELVDLPERW